MSFEMKRQSRLFEGKRLTLKILLFFLCDQKGCGVIFLRVISMRGHFKDAQSTLTQDRSRAFFLQ